MKLQLALDGTQEHGLQALRAARPWVDVVEAGTPLLLREGVAALRCLRAEFPRMTLLADFKIMDAGDLEARIAFAAGADQVTALGVAGDTTIAAALAAARNCGGELLVDLINVAQPLRRVKQLKALGCDYFCVHRAHDSCGDPVAPLRELRAALPDLRLAVAGGIDECTIKALAPYRPDTVIVGSAITGAAQPGLAARRIMERMRAHV
ncbi:MAG: orotidine 5'-phosphate decarboxylase [Anaerolineae bacterium]|nr:orotidine 5'-phosphate decarboxylase [Anaerolineae bacterium]